MTLRLEHPKGAPPPPEWEGRRSIPTAEVLAWLQSEGRPPPKVTGHPRGKAGIRPDLGHNCRSALEANLERFLRFSGYQMWTGEGEPPAGRWYRYEGRRWPLPGGCGDYLADYEVWPGLIDPQRPYEVLEAKGWLDSRSKTKLKRMAKLHPDSPVELITAQRLEELVGRGKSIIPHWE